MIGSTRYVASAEIARQGQLSAEMAKLQQSISTTKRLSAPSDDAAAAARVAEIRQAQADHVVWTRNASTGQGIAAAADTALGSVANLVTRGKELVLAGANQTTTADDRAIYARELMGIADDVDALAASKDPNGNALFPATEPDALPLSDTLRVAATASRAAVFDRVATAGGTASLSDVLRAAAAALTAPDTTTDAAGATVTRAQAITTAVADVDAAAEHVTLARTDQGLRAQRFDDAKAELAASDTDLAAERSGLEDTDLTYALSAFQAKDVALKAAQATYAQTHKSTLFDLLG